MRCTEMHDLYDHWNILFLSLMGRELGGFIPQWVAKKP